jgi:hypothetical protein
MEAVALEEATTLIRLEYHELPALSLTFWQAQRLWNLSDELCERALQSLVREKFLTMTPSGRFVRRSDSRSRAASSGRVALAG